MYHEITSYSYKNIGIHIFALMPSVISKFVSAWLLVLSIIYLNVLY